MSYLLETRNLCVEVDGKTLLYDINLVIPHGEVHALMGPNGSGKTSLMMTLMGFSAYKVTSGQILFNGEDITELGLTERAHLGIAVAQQRPPTIPGVKLRQILDHAANGSAQRASNIEKLSRSARIEDFLDRDINAGLSGGEIKRSELVQLIASEPRLVMLDEPESGVDLVAMNMVGSLVNQLFTQNGDHPVRRRTGLLITHTGQILNYVHADKAHVIMNGRMSCSGNPNLMLETIAQHGYQECIRCEQREA